MWQDPIVAETRALRDEYARQFNYDINGIFKDLMAKQAAHPERVVAFPPRKPIASAVAAQRIRLDRASAASHDLNRLLDEPDKREVTEEKATGV